LTIEIGEMRKSGIGAARSPRPACARIDTRSPGFQRGECAASTAIRRAVSATIARRLEPHDVAAGKRLVGAVRKLIYRDARERFVGHLSPLSVSPDCAENRSYSSTETTTTTPRACFSISDGSARVASIIRPKPFLASGADMVFMAESRGDPWCHLGRNGSFQQWRHSRLDSDAEGAD
jgi:hypothetical protein